jgi:hypothetical protein
VVKGENSVGERCADANVQEVVYLHLFLAVFGLADHEQLHLVVRGGESLGRDDSARDAEWERAKRREPLSEKE